MRRKGMDAHPKDVRTYPPGTIALPDADINTILQTLVDKVEINARDKFSNNNMNRFGLAAIDEHLAILELSIVSLERRMRLHVSEQRQGRNQSVLINHIPLEILVRIFSFVVDDGEAFSGHVEGLDNLGLVCHQWNHVVKGFPSLWTTLCPDEPRRLERALAHSSRLPLNIRCSGHADEHWRKGVGLHGVRWRSVRLYDVRLATLQWVLDVFAPNLKELEIWECSFPGWDRPKIRDEIIRGLDHISFRRNTVRWNPSCVSGLKSLHLEDLKKTNRISTSQLIVALRASHGLTDLRLGQDAVDESSWYEDTTPVKLPLLTSLSLETHPRVTRDILTFIRIPGCVNLKIASTCVTNIEVLDAQTIHISTVVRSILARLDEVNIKLQPSLVTLSKGESSLVTGVTLDIKLSYIHFPELARWLDTMLITLQDQHSIDLMVHIDVDDEDWD
ncbi:hypothetical protein FRB97_009438 [Tulasnella sp. 331]|nr:hypothetical protein FRB97_009438 [Tulasnella sp. 331]